MPERVTLEQHGRVTCLRMNHGKVNALDVELLRDLRESLSLVPADSSVVLTGNDRAFSAGLDLKRLLESDAAYTEALLRELVATTLAIFRHARPVVAAVHGPAIAGGAILALAADVRLMSQGVIGLPELSVGVPFPPDLIEVARYALGTALRGHLLQGAAVEPEAALTVGLIDGIIEADGLLQSAIQRAEVLAAAPASAYALVKEQLHAEAEARIAAVPAGRQTQVEDAWKSVEVRDAIQAQVDRMSRR